MKKVIIQTIFLWLFLLCAQGRTWAQTMPFSQVIRHNDVRGTEVITRALPSGAVLSCSKSVNGDGNHTFMIYKPTSSSTRCYTCNLGALFSLAADDYCIKDMYIFENKCYFCGYYVPSEIEPIYDPFGNIIDVTTYGFVGYFDLFPELSLPIGPGIVIPPPPPGPPLTNSSLDSIYLITIPETDSIMQIVAHHDSQTYDVFLMAVGYTSRYVFPTCVVELTKPVGTSDTYWSLNIVQPTCSVVDEYMTDIVLIEDYVVVASKLSYADGELDGDTDPTHYLFRLHEAKRDGFYNTTLPLSSSASVYQYDVSSYGVGIGCHHIGDPIRLCPLDGNRFCVYYHGEQRYPSMYNGVGGSVLFWMNEAQMMEHAAKIHGYIFSQTKEAAWVGDMYKTIAILMSDTYYFPEGAVLFPTLHPNPDMYGACLAQRIQDVNLHSIDCNPATQYLYIGGTYQDKKLCHGIQDEMNYCEDVISTCLDHNSFGFSMMDSQVTSEEYCDWSVRLENEQITAQKKYFEASSCDTDKRCTQEIE